MSLPAYKFEGLNSLGNGLIEHGSHQSWVSLSPMHATAARGSHDMERHWPSLARNVHLNQHAKIDVIVLWHSRSVIVRGVARWHSFVVPLRTLTLTCSA